MERTDKRRGFGKESPRYFSGTREWGPFVLLVGVACVDRGRESAKDFTSAAQAQRTLPRRGWLFPSPGRRSPTGLLPGVQPAKTAFTTNQDHRRLRSRQKSGCLRGQARGATNRASPPNRQPAGRHAPSFPEPGPPEAPLTLTSLTMNNSQEPTRTQAQATVGVEDDRREDDSQPPEERSERGPSHSGARPVASAKALYEVRHVAERSVGP